MSRTSQENKVDIDRLALLSHDIRSAVSDVMGGLRLVDHENLDAVNKDHIIRIRTAAELLARLLEDAAVTFSDDHFIEPKQTSSVKIEALLSDLIGRWSAHAREKGLIFEIIEEKELPGAIGADRLSVERILANLIGNAIKFTDEGRVSLLVRRTEDHGLCFCVVDTGPGFSDHAMRMLFNYEARPSENKKPGSGLGLFIAKQMADKLGLEILVENYVDGGAKVDLIIPAAMVQEVYQSRKPRGPLPNLTGTRVLLADDNKTNQLVISSMLKELGAEFVVVSDGIEALNSLKTQQFDIALIDIEMPYMDGLEVIAELRNMEAMGSTTNIHLPVLAVTAYVMRANREVILKTGADGIIAKPVVAIEPFAASIVEALKRSNKVVTFLDEDDVDPPSPLDEPQFQRLLELSGNSGAKELLSRLLSDFGAVRLGLRDAARQTDAKLVRNHAHILISLAGSVGADRLHKVANLLHGAEDFQDWQAVVQLVQQADKDISLVMTQMFVEYRKRFGET